jgi:hypothetical protein
VTEARGGCGNEWENKAFQSRRQLSSTTDSLHQQETGALALNWTSAMYRCNEHCNRKKQEGGSRWSRSPVLRLQVRALAGGTRLASRMVNGNLDWRVWSHLSRHQAPIPQRPSLQGHRRVRHQVTPQPYRLDAPATRTQLVLPRCDINIGSVGG